MKLIDIRLSNFQGIRSLEIPLNGKSAGIYGDNATGKTTVFNAVTWLLFGKPSTGAANWSPKTIGESGELHNLEHSASATFETKDGSRIVLGKTFQEVWKKKRGNPAPEFAGNTVGYFLDGVPVKEKEYNAAVSRHCGGEELMKLLTMPDYFPERMDWKKRRELLLEICGGIADAEVISESHELKELIGYLLKPGTTSQFYSVEEYAKIAKARKADLNRKLAEIPNRIDEANRAIPEGIEKKEILAERLRDASEQVEACRREISDVKAGSRDPNKEALAKARADLEEARADYARRTNEANAELYKSMEEADRQLMEKKREAEKENFNAETLAAQASKMVALRKDILKEYQEAFSMRFDASSEVCPTCGRRYPEDRIAELVGDFNQRKSEKLAAINEMGRREASKDRIAELEAESWEHEKREAALRQEAAALQEKRDKIAAKLGAVVPFEGTGEYTALQEKIRELEQAVLDADSGQAAGLKVLEDRLLVLQESEREIRRKMILVENAERQMERVRELEAEEKRLAAEYEKVERGVYLCELFTRTKAGFLTERINGKFKTVSFRLFTEQVNGGLSECCEVLVPGEGGAMVPYSTANNAGKVNAGLEIIAAVSEHFGQEMPVIVDNAESVTRLIDTGGQVIRLVVSEADKTLRVEAAA